MEKPTFKVYLFALLSMLFWGVSFVWVKIVFEHGYRPITVIFLRLVLSSLILYIVIRLMKRTQKIHRSDFKYFLLLALFQPFFYFLGESYGLTMVSSTVASVIIATIPVFTPVFSYMLVKEKISYINILGLLVSFIGILMMVFNQDFSFDASPRGIGLLFFAVASAIAYAIVIKRLTFKYSAFTIIKTQNILGALYFLPLFFIFDYQQFITIKPDFEAVSALVQLSVFASSAAYILYIPVVRQLGINRANMFTNFIPVFTALFSLMLLSENFDFNKIAGIIIVIAGTSISQIYKFVNRII